MNSHLMLLMSTLACIYLIHPYLRCFGSYINAIWSAVNLISSVRCEPVSDGQSVAYPCAALSACLF